MSTSSPSTNARPERSAPVTRAQQTETAHAPRAATGAKRHGHAGPALQPHPKRWLILFVILAAECMDLLDGTVVNVAAPTIHHDLHASATALQWIIGGYPTALAVGLLTGGRLGDLFGRRRTFLLGAAGFTVASVLCGVAPTTGILIAARIAQGLAGALMLPQGLGVLREVFPGQEFVKAFGLFGPVMGCAAMIGPIVGGGIVSLDLWHTGWRGVFLINLPLGALAVAGATRLLPRTGGRHARELDLAGVAIAGVAAVAIVYPLIQGRVLGWPGWCYGLIAAGVLLFGAFGVHLRRRVTAGRDPLVQPSIFGHRGYSAGALVMMLYFGGMVGAMLAITLYVQLGEGFSAIHAGLTLAPFPLGTALTAPLAGTVLARRPGRTLIQLGTVVSMVGYAGLAVIAAHVSHLSTWDLVGPLLVVGMGMGLFVVPAFGTIIGAVTDAETGSASGTLNALQQLGSGIGVAVLGTIFFSVLSHHGFSEALRHTVWWQVGGLGALLLVSPLLPATPAAAASQAVPTGSR
ncbi:MAG TPA: MFS transporter [Solirubrobacteraceae bacterium]|nr:MFS transporter [Solirubrobacteraceae bacterium]